MLSVFFVKLTSLFICTVGVGGIIIAERPLEDWLPKGAGILNF